MKIMEKGGDDMILVTGGTAQGKREFVERDLIGELAGERTGGMAGGTAGGRAVIWVDGAAAEPDCFLSAPFCHNLQAFVRRIVSGEIAVDLVELTELMQKARPDRVIVTDEIGGGIVPTDPLERTWREETGRVCCCLAAAAGQVWRVNCGLGQRIK